jgi:hypothetical protein
MKEDFQRFWDYVYPACAGKFLDELCTRTLRSRIEPMKKVARMLRDKRELVLNWFRAEGKLSAGIVEGFNNKLKLITRKSYTWSCPDIFAYAAVRIKFFVAFTSPDTLFVTLPDTPIAEKLRASVVTSAYRGSVALTPACLVMDSTSMRLIDSRKAN